MEHHCQMHCAELNKNFRPPYSLAAHILNITTGLSQPEVKHTSALPNFIAFF